MKFMERDKKNARFIFRDAPIQSGVTSIGVSLLGLGIGVTLVVWGLFVALIKLLAIPFRSKSKDLQ
jgi:tetrahydromethanopterin S-methyltransferase subunit F